MEEEVSSCEKDLPVTLAREIVESAKRRMNLHALYHQGNDQKQQTEEGEPEVVCGQLPQLIAKLPKQTEHSEGHD